MVKNNIYHFVRSNLGVEIFLKWNRRSRLLSTLFIGVSRKFHLHFTFMFWLRYYKMMQSLQNSCNSWFATLGFKNHTRNWDNCRQAVESPKSWISMDHFCSKNKFCQLQLKRNIQRIYLTLISTICVKIRRIPFIFETLSHFSRHNSSVFFGSNITYFLQM